jgi:hypothetical protein
MIKIERKHDCESFFRKDELYDSKREKEYKVVFLGITLFKRTDKYGTDIKSDNGKNMGFK